METIHNSQFIKIDYDSQKSLFIFHFSNMGDMTNSQFEKELEIQAKLSETYNPKGFLFHSKNFEFTISPEIQKWIDEKIFPRYIKAGVKKFAYIMSSDMVAQLSIEQTMEEQQASQGFQTNYFDNEADARKWLLDS